MVDVSIIIVAWNVRDLLQQCLQSVFDQTRQIEFEVIYVDNASTDGSVEMVRQQFPAVRIVQNKENKGFIKANNQGIELAQGRYVLLLNSDTIVLDNAIAKLVAFADAHPEAAVVGCKVLNPDRTLQRNCFMYPSLLNMVLWATYLYKLFPRNRFFGRQRMTWWDFDEVREVETVCGSCSLVRKQAIEQVGVMNELYFTYGDDPDWCYRFHKAGWKILYTPEAQIIHYGGQTTKRLVGKFIWQRLGSKLIFMRLHRPRVQFPIARLLVALFMFLRVPYWLARAILRKHDRRYSMEIAKTYLIGTYYCLTDWKNLLMNKQQVASKL